jgi:hypothetical protein
MTGPGAVPCSARLHRRLRPRQRRGGELREVPATDQAIRRTGRLTPALPTPISLPAPGFERQGGSHG